MISTKYNTNAAINALSASNIQGMKIEDIKAIKPAQLKTLINKIRNIESDPEASTKISEEIKGKITEAAAAAASGNAAAGNAAAAGKVAASGNAAAGKAAGKGAAAGKVAASGAASSGTTVSVVSQGEGPKTNISKIGEKNKVFVVPAQKGGRRKRTRRGKSKRARHSRRR